MMRPSPAADSGAAEFAPLHAATSTLHRPLDPVAFDWIRLIFVRDGSAIVLSEFGERPVRIGDVVLLGANVLCGVEPEEHFTITTIYVDTDYVIDQIFWRHVGLLQDRLDAHDFAATIFTDPAQILRLGESHAGMLMPWLDELVGLAVQDQPIPNFYRMQALWFSIAHVIVPFVRISNVRVSSTQRATTWPTAPRIRGSRPLRTEARSVARLLREKPSRRWSVAELADEVHLSKSQVNRLFVDAFGKSPIAYLTMIRTEQMAALLRTTDAPITVIAREVGWSDADFATRQFRRSIGVTPTDYRRLSRAHAHSTSG